jgi:hypothetical protein
MSTIFQFNDQLVWRLPNKLYIYIYTDVYMLYIYNIYIYNIHIYIIIYIFIRYMYTFLFLHLMIYIFASCCFPSKLSHPYVKSRGFNRYHHRKRTVHSFRPRGPHNDLKKWESMDQTISSYGFVKLTGAKHREWMGCWGLLGWLLLVIMDHSWKFPAKHQ